MENQDKQGNRGKIGLSESVIMPKEYNIEREALQDLAKDMERRSEPATILEKVKGKPIKVMIRDEKYEIIEVEAIISEKAEDLPGSVNLWVEDWKGFRLPKPWAIKIVQ